MKPRDMAGNDFIVLCTALAMQLFMTRFKRESNVKCNLDRKRIQTLSNDLYSVIMRHWKEWK